MQQIIPLTIRSFAIVKKDSQPMTEPEHRGFRWASQIRSLVVPAPSAAACALLMVEYGVNISLPNLWSSDFDGTNLFKVSRRKRFVLRPDKITKDERENLHNDNSPALVSGNDKFYFLHGLEISGQDLKWLETPPEKLDPQEILAIPNADLRREMIRRKGIEQVLDGLFHRVID